MFRKPCTEDFKICSSKSNPDECIILKYFGNEKILLIPETINHTKPTAIKANAFRENQMTKIIILPESITHIEDQTFNNIEDIVLYSKRSWKDSSLSSSLNIKVRLGFVELYVYNDILYALFDEQNGKYAYIIGKGSNDLDYNSAYKSYNILELETQIGGYLVKGIESYAFSKGLDAEQIILPKQLTSIGSYAFDYCHNLKQIIIPLSVEKIGYDCFHNIPYATILVEGNPRFDTNWNLEELPVYYQYLETVIIDDLIYALFQDQSAVVIGNIINIIRDVHVPDVIEIYEVKFQVIEISSFAFMNCRYLKKVKIHKSINRIRQYAFKDSGITTLECKGNTTIEAGILFDCIHLKTFILPKKIETLPKNLCFNCQSLNSINIPDTVVTIESGAFMECHNLSKVKFPISLKNVEAFAFSETRIVKPSEMIFDFQGVYAFDKFAIEHLEES